MRPLISQQICTVHGTHEYWLLIDACDVKAGSLSCTTHSKSYFCNNDLVNLLNPGDRSRYKELSHMVEGRSMVFTYLWCSIHPVTENIGYNNDTMIIECIIVEVRII